MSFKFIDLFCGIGGFHAALSALGGECVLASDIDEPARRVYSDNWNHDPVGDINDFANEEFVEVPNHDVLVGGFPCQPFSKSGYQKGMDEVRGTLFWNIARIIEAKMPSVVLLENVRNLVGPRHLHEWQIIIKTLRDLGYRVSETPFIVSPHQLKSEFGGRPQVRERVLISATRYPKGWHEIVTDVQPPNLGWAINEKPDWNLGRDLPLQSSDEIDQENVFLTGEERRWIKTWDSFVRAIRSDAGKLPGFPIWFDVWPVRKGKELLKKHSSFPQWKNEFIDKNLEFFKIHEKVIKDWYKKNSEIDNFPPSRRKLEWQAQDTKSLWGCILHFRPSGIRAKKATYVPALVAMNQTSILADEKRRLTVREAARLQGFPEWFRFFSQSESLSYKQLGNAVNVGVIYQVMKAQVKRDFDLLLENPDLLRAILSAPDNPDIVLSNPANLYRSAKLAFRTKQIQQEIPFRVVN